MREPGKKGLSWEAGEEAPGCVWSGKTLEGGACTPLKQRQGSREGGRTAHLVWVWDLLFGDKLKLS